MDRGMGNRFRNPYDPKPPTEKVPGYDIGIGGALTPLPGEEEFFNAIMARRGRGLESTAAAQRTSLFNALESRGLGQSSVVSMGLADIGRMQGQGLAEAGADVANQQFLMREGRVRDALEFERQKALMKAGTTKVPWWASALGNVGNALGTYYGLRGSGGGGNARGWESTFWGAK